MEPLKAQKLCIELMNQYGLNEESNWTFEWFNSKNTAGQCCPIVTRIGRTIVGVKSGKIRLSRIVTAIHSDEKVRDTILHEIAHALTPGHHHDSVWRRKAVSIGCSGERCFKDCDELKELHMKNKKYSACCPRCNQDFHMTRLPKRDQWCRCIRKSLGNLPQEFKLIWKTIGTQQESKYASKAPTDPANNFMTTRTGTVSFPNSLLDQAPDSYKKMLDKFDAEFQIYIGNNRATFDMIVFSAVRNSTSWRTMNREVRKACDAYCAKQNIMSHRQFQEKFFYESIMIGRTTWGKNAPWI